MHLPVSTHPAATGRRVPAWAAALAMLLALLLAGSGCGYRQDAPRLPVGAQSLALHDVQNRTQQAELDVRLRGELLGRLERHAHVRLLPEARSTLLLEVALDEFTITRTLDPAITSDRSFVYQLTGRMSLTDQRNGYRLIDNAGVSASVSRLYAPDVVETPAIRDEGINDVLERFAEQVEHRLFLVF